MLAQCYQIMKKKRGVHSPFLPWRVQRSGGEGRLGSPHGTKRIPDLLILSRVPILWPKKPKLPLTHLLTGTSIEKHLWTTLTWAQDGARRTPRWNVLSANSALEDILKECYVFQFDALIKTNSCTNGFVLKWTRVSRSYSEGGHQAALSFSATPWLPGLEQITHRLLAP